jgi:hypothetical protein
MKGDKSGEQSFSLAQARIERILSLRACLARRAHAICFAAGTSRRRVGFQAH